MKHYTKPGSSEFCEVLLLFDVRFNFHDVRSGFHGLHWGLFAAPPLLDPELDWTPDMVTEVGEDEVQEIEAPGSALWPLGSDDQMRRFHARYYRVGICWNPELGAYSRPGEARDEFVRRCEEMAGDEKEAALQQIRQLYLRRILELEQRALAFLQQPGWEHEQVDRRAADVKDVFASIRDAFSRCLATPLTEVLEVPEFDWQARLDVESRERVESVWKDFFAGLGEVRKRLLERALLIEVYEVTLNHSDIDVQPRGFLWL